MDTRNILDTRRRARGAVRPLVIAIIAVFVLLGVGVWLLILRPHQELMMADAGGHPSTPVSVTSKSALPPPANVAVMDVSQLLAEARTAMNEQRYLAPTGNNAFEFYLRVLEKDPGNKVASDALRETFPFAATSAEQSINGRDFAEAQRQIDLLAKADPANFTLTILRSKLDAQHKLQDKQQQDVVDQQKAQQLAQQKAVADKLAGEQLAAQQEAAAESAKKAQQAKAVARPAISEGQANTSASTAAPVAAGGATSGSELVKAQAPSYPSSALRAHQTGWVVVSFTINSEGRTTDVHVVDSQPRRVFDRAAMDAVNRYRFKPAMKNGTAVASSSELKIEFNL